MKYYKKAPTPTTLVGLYRTEEITFPDGTPGLLLERFNWVTEEWGGHISDYAATRKGIAEGVIKEIGRKEAREAILKGWDECQFLSEEEVREMLQDLFTE